MKWDALLDYCLAKPGAWPDEPWGDGVVTKVGPKIFAFLRSVGPDGEALGVGVKCGAMKVQRVFTYDGDPKGFIERPAASMPGDGSLKVGHVPPYSMSVVELGP